MEGDLWTFDPTEDRNRFTNSTASARLSPFRRRYMTTQRWSLVILALSLFCLWAFALPALSSLPSTGHSEDERVIRQRNEECLKAHDAADVATLDRIEDAHFTSSGDFG